MKSQRHTFKTILSAFALILILASCRENEEPIPAEVEEVPGQGSSFYLLNEGNMNMNKASLDFYDAKAGKYKRNIYEEANPEVTLGLGDVGNDAQVYGGKLYVVVDVSGKVEVLDVRTGKRLKQISIKNCRYITFHQGKAYVSSYNANIGSTGTANGFVAQIDTATLAIERTVTVGRQPEGVAIVGEKLYVANSGGYNPEQLERTISVVDLNTLKETNRIEVADNLHRLKADKYGDLYVTSRGNSKGETAKLFVIGTQTASVKHTFDVAGNFWIDEDLGYIISTVQDKTTGNRTIRYSLIDIKEEKLLPQSFIEDAAAKEISKPYGIAVDPVTKAVYLTDAKDYVTPGTLYCFNKEGKKVWSVTTGDIPAHIAFIK
ncbi:YncE family protein [Pontibacter arcticus]|uniref:YncE family protein n=1 Tax=Pontibacter arcticus TaxID=2080288 RepID=A0A364RIQ0_9BACT|nr:YncE family protein [Pontibacter arcticus]RAU84161.1 YncE family protein [Pontibacter arcticus]